MALPSLNEEKPASFYPFDTSLGMKGKGKGKKDNSEVGSDTARYGDRRGQGGRAGGREGESGWTLRWLSRGNVEMAYALGA